jgi:GDSL-like Lipase/Acylhydrolase family
MGFMRMSPRARHAALLLTSLAISVALAEGALRLFIGEPRALGKLYFRDADGGIVAVEGAHQESRKRGLSEDLPADQTPPNRPRSRFAPGARFFMCYEDAPRLDADWLDAKGCVEVRINEFGLRERPEIRPDNKAADERRVVCIGDSFTFGWGIPEEMGWVRMLEGELRQSHGNVRTVNCGASGALTVDEYEVGLRTRFGAFQPDLVIVSIYMNDLIPSHGLCVLGAQPKRTGWLLLDYYYSATQPSALDLDPTADWVKATLELPREAGEQMGVYGPDKPFDGMWSQGAPQRALAAMSAWCKDRKCSLSVVLWPFLQGLGSGKFYPFEALHRMVAEHCAQLGIPTLDLLPTLRTQPSERLWVTPQDMHANPRAQQMALPAISDFVRTNWRI